MPTLIYRNAKVGAALIYAPAPYVVSGDTTAPTLTAASATTTGPTTATGSVTTNEAGGTLFGTATASATATATQVQAGISKAVTAAGAQSMSFTGLLPSSTLYPHYVHVDSAGNESAVVNGASFTTSSGGGGMRTISISFGNVDGAYANLTGLSVACWNESTLSTLTNVIYQSAVQTTDANGALNFSFTSSRAVGDMVYLAVYGPNGIHYNGAWALT